MVVLQFALAFVLVASWSRLSGFGFGRLAFGCSHFASHASHTAFLTHCCPAACLPGVAPCSEIILRPYQFCNLTEVVVRAGDDLAALQRKARLAAILGTFQASLVDFPYLRDVWRANTAEERLLGVSLTGIMDNRLMSGQQGMDNLEQALNDIKASAVKVRADTRGMTACSRPREIPCLAGAMSAMQAWGTLPAASTERTYWCHGMLGADVG